MLRRMLAALTVAAVSTGGAMADEPPAVKLGRYVPGQSGFGGGVATPADALEAVPADGPDGDTQKVWGWRRGFYGGGFYRPYYGFGYSNFYRPYYGFGYSNFYRPWGGYYSFYRPGFAYSAYNFGYPSYYYGYSSFYYPGWCGIGLPGGVSVTASNLGAIPSAATYADPTPSYTQPLPQAVAPAQPTPSRPQAADGTFQYDGGPSAPVPQPTPDASVPAQPQRFRAAPEDPGTVQISFPARPATSIPAKPMYKFTAYGEKR